MTERVKEKEKYNLHEYVLPGGWQVLAGKSDEGNDFLSLKAADPNDYWFHVRGTPGSHVILRAKPEEEPGREILKQTAAIAAFHSKAKDGGITPVSFTRARYVTKPSGARVGSVQIRKESVIKVRPGLPEG